MKYKVGDRLECIESMQVEVNWGELIYTVGCVYTIDLRVERYPHYYYYYHITSDNGIVYQFDLADLRKTFKLCDDVGCFDYAMCVI